MSPPTYHIHIVQSGGHHVDKGALITAQRIARDVAKNLKRTPEVRWVKDGIELSGNYTRDEIVSIMQTMGKTLKSCEISLVDDVSKDDRRERQYQQTIERFAEEKKTLQGEVKDLRRNYLQLEGLIDKEIIVPKDMSIEDEFAYIFKTKYGKAFDEVAALYQNADDTAKEIGGNLNTIVLILESGNRPFEETKEYKRQLWLKTNLDKLIRKAAKENRDAIPTLNQQLEQVNGEIGRLKRAHDGAHGHIGKIQAAIAPLQGKSVSLMYIDGGNARIVLPCCPDDKGALSNALQAYVESRLVAGNVSFTKTEQKNGTTCMTYELAQRISPDALFYARPEFAQLGISLNVKMYDERTYSLERRVEEEKPRQAASAAQPPAKAPVPPSSKNGKANMETINGIIDQAHREHVPMTDPRTVLQASRCTDESLAQYGMIFYAAAKVPGDALTTEQFFGIVEESTGRELTSEEKLKYHNRLTNLFQKGILLEPSGAAGTYRKKHPLI